MNDPSLRRGGRVAVGPAAHADELSAHAPRGSLAALAIGALGVVYGDIGTSPLYAIDQIFLGPARVTPTSDNVVPIVNSIQLALRRESVDALSHGRHAQTGLVGGRRIVPIKSFASGGDPDVAPPAQCAATKIAEAA